MFCKFKIALADILETQCWAACGTVSCCQLPILYISWDATIAHAMHEQACADRAGGVCCERQHAPSRVVIVTLSC